MDNNFYSTINPFVGRLLGKADSEEDLAEKFNYLYYSVEATIKLLGIISVSFYRDEKLFNESIEDQIKKLKKPSIGIFPNLIRKIYKEYKNHKSYPLSKELFESVSLKDNEWKKVRDFYKVVSEKFGGKLKESISIMDFFDKMTQFRNKKIGHGAGSAKEWIEERKMDEAIEIVLKRVPELKKYKLLNLTEIRFPSNKSIVGKFKEIMMVDEFSRPFEVENIDPKMKYGLYLFEPNDKKFLRLHPFIIEIEGNLFILNESSSKKEEYLNYYSGAQEDFSKLKEDINEVIGTKEHKGLTGKVFKIKDKSIYLVKGIPGTIIEMGNIARKDYGDDKLNDINFRFPDISRRHFKLTIQDDEMYGEDIESKYGVVYNGTKWNPQLPFKIKGKGNIKIGLMVEFSIFKDDKSNIFLNYVEPSETRLLLIDKEQLKLLPPKDTRIIILKSELDLSQFGINARVGVSSEGIVVLSGEIEFDEIDNVII